VDGVADVGTGVKWAREDHVHPTDTSRADAAATTAALALKAPLASPALTGTPTAPTPSAGDNSTTIATTAYVDDAVGGVGAATKKYVGFYNGNGPNTTPASTYNFGLATGSSYLAVGRAGVLAPVWDHSATYKDTGGRICPCPIIVGDRIFVYYEGFDGTRKSIFLEIYSKEGGLMEKPLEPVILYSDISGATSVQRPAVLYEPSDSGAPFKMIFTRATSGVNAATLWAATSLDGVNWSSVGLVLSISSGWESTYLETSGRFLKDGSTYRLFYRA
jgi:hypothetical protein